MKNQEWTPTCLFLSIFIFILDGSGSLMSSISSLINSIFNSQTDFSCCTWSMFFSCRMMWIFSSIYSELLWEGLHCRCELWSSSDTETHRTRSGEIKNNLLFLITTSLNLQQKSELRLLSQEVNLTDALLMLSTFRVIGFFVCCTCHTFRCTHSRVNHKHWFKLWVDREHLYRALWVLAQWYYAAPESSPQLGN